MNIKGSLCLLALCCVFSQQAIAKQIRSRPAAENTGNCYDAADPRDIRLWDGSAPGATGDDPCRDIPYLRVFPADSGKSVVKTESKTAILVMPGGGYDRLSNKKEQIPVGEYFAKTLHTTTFVLYYRLVQEDGTYRYPIPMWDGQRALKLIRHDASKYSIDPQRIGVFGFSAGGHLATTLALHAGTDFNLPVHDAVDEVKARPDFLGLGYPVISMLHNQFGKSPSHDHLLDAYQGRELTDLEKYLSGQENVTSHTPPVFLFVSKDDQRVDPQHSILFAQALQSAKIPVEFHLFEHGEHGAGLAQDLPEEQAWPDLFYQWLLRQHFLP